MTDSIARNTAGRLADQIKETVTGRGANYGPPEINFENIAAFWRAWLKARHGIAVAIDGHDVGQMSAMIKVARLAQSPLHEDSALDGAIYMMLGHGCAVDASQVAAAAHSEPPAVDPEKDRAATKIFEGCAFQPLVLDLEQFPPFITWSGEGFLMPDVPVNSCVQVLTRDGKKQSATVRSLRWYWASPDHSFEDPNDDIMGYRVLA